MERFDAEKGPESSSLVGEVRRPSLLGLKVKGRAPVKAVVSVVAMILGEEAEVEAVVVATDTVPPDIVMISDEFREQGLDDGWALGK